ncbi:D-alanyl-D-alanine carboxypeptidase family protein [Roseococcus sp. YIM B11640]|uniref:D-alanyl-D-alanine carboxypeptidase family protein n=1 Tax=Roseococcus sp. YIM B11640 TaxID=3133973 RepID=UPI003C7A5A6F
MAVSAMLRAVLGATLALGLLSVRAEAQITQSLRYSGIVVDMRTGNTLIAEAADEPRHPASLTKMMTLYLLFEALRDGRVSLSSPVVVSAEAASRPPSKLGVPAGGSISVESAILALVTRSANDIATAVGEMLANGDEDSFARMMTQRARSLGMSRTTFRNASGLPDPDQITTARDMTQLGRRLIQDFPDRYHYFGLTHFAHGNRMIRNHNGMLRDYPGADGIKTGYINASGFNIVTSAQRDGVRLVGAVFGGNSWAQRNNRMAELLDDGFARLGVRSVPAVATPRVMAGRDATIGPGPRAAIRQVSLREAPARAGRAVATTTATTRTTRATRSARAATTTQATRTTTRTRATAAATAPAAPRAARTTTTRTRQTRSAGTTTQTRSATTTQARGTAPATRNAAAAPAPATPPRQQFARNPG